MRKFIAGAALMAALASGPAGAQQASDGQIPTPESLLGFRIGADYKLADWDEITRYMNRLADASDRVTLDTLGTTTLGRPFIALTLSSPENLARLAHFREIQAKLADPRRLSSELEAEALIREGRVVVLITAGIHSTEVGTYQVPMQIAYRLAAGDDQLTRKILDEVILLLVPSLNPDGSQMVVDWYETTLGQPWEGVSPPFLYHHYVGHDNNRDWYIFTQKETQITVTQLHNLWHPQIIHDIHQMGSRGPRFFIPPWTDPIEPNVDPLLVAGINALGTAMAWELYAQGKRGIVVNAIYDAWTPARAYQHYHAGVRILTETASARMASPVELTSDSMQTRRDVDPRVSSWRFPEPWPPGTWRLSDIVDYMESGAMALLKQAALYREDWLESFYQISLRAIGGRDGWPRAYVIPAAGQNPDGLAELLRILETGGVEVRRALSRFEIDGREFPTGTYVVSLDQPYAGFAKTLLEPQRYPDLREYPGGPLKPPYDVTANTLPYMMGVDAVMTSDPVGAELSGPIPAPSHKKEVPGLTNRRRQPRLAIYESWDASMDAGWTRWIFDEYGIDYERLRDVEARAGNLRASYDVIILPDQPPQEITSGHRPGSMPPEYAGGLGEAGLQALSEFVEAGGTLVTFNRSSALPIERFDLPVINLLDDLDRSDFYVPGSILRLRLRPDHWLTAGVPSKTAAWFEAGLAFEPREGGEDRVEIVGRYGTDDLLLSGWINGAEWIAGHGAVAVVKQGSGRVVLFGFRPQYRGQTIATYPLIFNALKQSLVTAASRD